MRFWKISPLLAFVLFTTAALPKYAFAQENAAPQATSPDTPVKAGPDVVPPVLVHSVEPKFPRQLRVANTAVIVSVGLTIDRDGKPINLHIVKSSDPNFDKMSMDTVAKYRFKPATLHGQPIPVELVVQVNLQVK